MWVKILRGVLKINLVKTRDDLERDAPRLKKEWIQKIDSIDNVNRKYLLKIRKQSVWASL